METAEIDMAVELECFTLTLVAWIKVRDLDANFQNKQVALATIILVMLFFSCPCAVCS